MFQRSNQIQHQMKNPNFLYNTIRTTVPMLLLAGSCMSVGLHAQESSGVEGDDIYEMSPFVVSGSEVGYQATQSLAGTRIKSDLRDVAGAIQVVTPEFLQDTAATDAESLLVYTTNTEVSGPDGNYSGANGGAEDDGARRASNQPTRVRGLVGADQTRDYFLTDIGFETYNTERVVINRGPNAILFGLGSPGGIINNNTKKALFADYHELSLSYESFDSHREVLDLNQEIIDNKWAIRAIGLNKHEGFQQEEGYRDEERVFVASTARFTPTTTLRFNAEFGNMESARPSGLTPKRVGVRWIEDGMPVNELVGKIPNTTNADGRLLFQIMTHNRGPMFYVTSLEPLTFGLGHHGGVLDMARPRTLGDNRDNRLSMEPMTDEDSWFFDFRNHYLPGRSNIQDNDFSTYNITLEQTFLDNSAGIEVAFDKQEYEEGYLDRVRKTPYVDVNRFTVDGQPNPNLGRPWLESIPSFNRENTEREVLRITGFYELDLTDKGDKLGKWLGRHVFTGNYTEQTIDSKEWGGDDNVDLATDAILEANRGSPGAFFATSFDRMAQGIVYIGDPISGEREASMHSITLPDIQSYPSYMFDSTLGENGEFVSRDISVLTRSIVSASLNRQEIESVALNLQSHFLNEHIVTTLGWREDESSQYTDNSPERTADQIVRLETLEIPDEASASASGEIFSWGIVGHMPASWSERFLMGLNLSVHYGESENFQPLPGRLNLWNEPLASPTGDTKEYGFTIGTPENKFVMRVNWYETNMTGLSIGGNANIPNYERLFYNGVRIYAQGPGEANENWDSDYILPPLELRELYWTPADPDPSRGGTPTVADIPNPNVMDTEDLSAEGIEFEGIFNPTRNWTITFNVAKQKSVKSNIRPAQLRYLDLRIPQWRAMEDLVVRSSGETIGYYAEPVIAKGILDAAALEGALNPEVREWRVNVVTRYSFEQEGWLEGVKVGGAARWQEAGAIGFEDREDRVDDVTKPLYGDDEFNLDFFVSRTQKLFNGKVDWTLQLNIRNVLDNDDLVPIAKNYNGAVASYFIPNPRTFMVTSTFKF
jgi:outer membrane receptor protein involved in Fe transport